ncbi:MAG: universal stress protein [Chloroflexaceae bacterium]|jgi:nucleotide-binding universal stress UspA family protein|nr:universal stress protein [Chloroflexaceae bacterium]
MYNHILVPLDGSRLAEQIIPHVEALATVGSTPTITLMRAVPREYPDPIEGATSHDIHDPMRQLTGEARTYLDDVASRLRSKGHTVETEVMIKPPADAIVDFASHHNVDLIAIATHGRSGVGRFMYGSVTQKVMSATSVPMLVVRPTD